MVALKQSAILLIKSNLRCHAGSYHSSIDTALMSMGSCNFFGPMDVREDLISRALLSRIELWHRSTTDPAWDTTSCKTSNIKHRKLTRIRDCSNHPSHRETTRGQVAQGSPPMNLGPSHRQKPPPLVVRGYNKLKGEFSTRGGRCLTSHQ